MMCKIFKLTKTTRFYSITFATIQLTDTGHNMTQKIFVFENCSKQLPNGPQPSIKTIFASPLKFSKSVGLPSFLNEKKSNVAEVWSIILSKSKIQNSFRSNENCL